MSRTKKQVMAKKSSGDVETMPIIYKNKNKGPRRPMPVMLSAAGHDLPAAAAAFRSCRTFGSRSILTALLNSGEIRGIARRKPRRCTVPGVLPAVGRDLSYLQSRVARHPATAVRPCVGEEVPQGQVKHLRGSKVNPSDRAQES